MSDFYVTDIYTSVLWVFLTLKSTSNDATDVCTNHNPDQWIGHRSDHDLRSWRQWMPIWGVDTDLNQDTDLSLSYFFFQNLCQEKQRFLTERTIQQYLGLIRNNFNMLDSEKHKGSPKDRKLFYQVIRVRVMLFNATFNNISVISWRSVL
jgi:hypothetical protein